MYCCVFWCEFNDLVNFYGCFCLTAVTLFIIRKCTLYKESDRGQPITVKKIEQNCKLSFISTVHGPKQESPKCHIHQCCWEAFP